MITAEEREDLIAEAERRILLKLPEVIGNLMADSANLLKLNKEFYKTNPEFERNKELVRSVVEQMESSNPGVPYKRILELSTPIIKDRMRTVSNLDNSASRPSRDISSIITDLIPDHGKL